MGLAVCQKPMSHVLQTAQLITLWVHPCNCIVHSNTIYITTQRGCCWILSEESGRFCFGCGLVSAYAATRTSAIDFQAATLYNVHGGRWILGSGLLSDVRPLVFLLAIAPFLPFAWPEQYLPVYLCWFVLSSCTFITRIGRFDAWALVLWGFCVSLRAISDEKLILTLF